MIQIKTKAYIRKHIDTLSHFEIEEVLETGLIASIRGIIPGDTIALRADMDGLPINEINEISVSDNVVTALTLLFP